MRAVTRLFGLVAAGALVAGSAQAQTCSGFPAFSAGLMNLSAMLQSGNDITTFGGVLNLSHGAGAPHVITAGLAMNTFDAPPGADDNNMSMLIGGSLRKTTATGLEWCPGISFGYTTDVKIMDIGAGVSLGKALTPSGGLTLAPFGSIGFIMHQYDNDAIDDDTGIIFGGGLGLRLNSGMQITPSVWKDASVNDSDMVLRVVVSWPMGAKSM